MMGWMFEAIYRTTAFAAISAVAALFLEAMTGVLEMGMLD